MNLKVKLIAFSVICFLLEIVGFLVIVAMQAIYKIQHQGLGLSEQFGTVYISYFFHPISAIKDCILANNPFIFIIPIGIVVFSVYIAMRTKDNHVGIENAYTVHGSANWESMEKFLMVNKRGKQALKAVKVQEMIQEFLKEIGENENT